MPFRWPTFFASMNNSSLDMEKEILLYLLLVTESQTLFFQRPSWRFAFRLTLLLTGLSFRCLALFSKGVLEAPVSCFYESEGSNAREGAALFPLRIVRISPHRCSRMRRSLYLVWPLLCLPSVSNLFLLKLGMVSSLTPRVRKVA